MVCPYCGNKIHEGDVYCPKCGKEIQMISADDDLEEEILRKFVDEDQRPNQEKSKKSTMLAEAKARIRRRRIRALIIVLVAAAVALAAFGVIRVRQNHSPEYLLSKAQSEYIGREYESARNHLEKLFELGSENETAEALLLAGQVCAAIPDYEAAEDYYLRAIAADPDSYAAYEGILKVYAKQDKIDEINALKKGVTDEDILALFDKYVVATPTISVKSGTFSEYFTVELKTNKKGLTIYYTLDGSIPDRTDYLYTSPIDIDEQGTITLTAVCMDENGTYSEPVSETYTVELDPPNMPVATPDGGRFTEPATVTVTAPAGTTIYYTWDNTTPTLKSSVYTEPLEIPVGNNVLSLIAVDENGMRSNVLRCNYIYYPETSPESLYADDGEEETSGNVDATQEITSDVGRPSSYEDEEEEAEEEEEADEDENENGYEDAEEDNEETEEEEEEDDTGPEAEEEEEEREEPVAERIDEP